MPNGDPDKLAVKDKLDYAWKWFEYHAGQRLVAFNFLVVIMGALAVGYYKAYDGGSYWYAGSAALFGAFVSIGFLCLDVRNRGLVQLGREALEGIEKATMPENDPGRIATKPVKKDREKRPLDFVSHTFWLRAIEVLLFVLFVFATGAAGYKLVEQWNSSTKERAAGSVKMPYIAQDRRAAILAGAKPQDAGELNFAITTMVDNFLKEKGELRYSHLNEVIGALDCAKLELYRRVAAPHEDKKNAENGEVYSTAPKPESKRATTPP